jgi:hypothetical protein
MHEVRMINQMSPNPEIASAYIPFWRSGQRSRYSDMLRAGGLADRISGGGVEIFRTPQDRARSPPSLL